MSAPSAFPRVVVAGLSGDAGKTLVSLSLLLALRDRNLRTAAFKKGPDYIDAAWLTWASGSPTRNLDSYLMGFPEAASSFARHALADGVNIIEGNRGLFDGADASGTHSTAALAQALQAPVLLVVNAAKMTRTAAALVLGCQKLDPSLPIGGVILNRLGGSRHESLARQAVESECGIPVLGALPEPVQQPSCRNGTWDWSLPQKIRASPSWKQNSEMSRGGAWMRTGSSTSPVQPLRSPGRNSRRMSCRMPGG